MTTADYSNMTTKQKPMEVHGQEQQQGSKMQELTTLLDNTEHVFIKQPVRMGEFCMENILHCEMENRYEVFRMGNDNKSSVHIFTFQEQSGFCARQCLRSKRPLTLEALKSGTDPDNYNDEAVLFNVDRPYRCGVWCCAPTAGCCGRGMMSIVADGQVLGTIEEDFRCIGCSYSVCDNQHNVICQIQRNCCVICECMCDVAFDIVIGGEPTGAQISKLFSGIQELFTTNDNFVVQFPKSLRSTNNKLLMIGAAMMIEFMYFEKKEGAP